MRYSYSILRAALALSLAGAACSLRADELGDKGRDIFRKYQQTVVTVQVVQKITYSGAAKSGENRQELTGTVVDPSGLTVLALSACDPSEMYQRMLAQQGSQNKLEIEVADMQILLAWHRVAPRLCCGTRIRSGLCPAQVQTATPMTADLARPSTVQILTRSSPQLPVRCWTFMPLPSSGSTPLSRSRALSTPDSK